MLKFHVINTSYKQHGILLVLVWAWKKYIFHGTAQYYLILLQRLSQESIFFFWILNNACVARHCGSTPEQIHEQMNCELLTDLAARRWGARRWGWGEPGLVWCPCTCPHWSAPRQRRTARYSTRSQSLPPPWSLQRLRGLPEQEINNSTIKNKLCKLIM